MSKKNLITVIMFILIALGLLLFLWQLSSKDNPVEVVMQTRGAGVVVPAAGKVPAKEVIVKETEADVYNKKGKVIERDFEIDAAVFNLESKNAFWGNRGYLIKKGKTTFIKYALQEQMRRAQGQMIIGHEEPGAMGPYLK